ncbi:cytochrome P450 [Dendrothele bispora CBS 962.96]|uniref:Cytochrome P450 n=1 Tax=Dendrothele bispora (strain CBS 962.96) TaxID=1314807 RepID=A0A4S8MRS8_DENBC|nr:cytochrome P450 [Dendrothele bispora CBS 962.96]
MMDLNLFAALISATLALVFFFRKRPATPPGPLGLPLIGNVFDLPKRESWKVYLQWSKEYNSDIICLNMMGNRLFILNSVTVVQDLLSKRSSIYSDRPRSTLLDLIGTSWIIPFMDNTYEWKEHRRLFRREFDTADQSATNKSHEVKAARRLLPRLLACKEHDEELRLGAVDAILSITYGITPTNFDHPFIRTPEGINAIFADVAKGGYLVDVFPSLKALPRWLPGVQFHKVADKGKPLARALVMDPYLEVQRQMADGTAVPSVASKFLSVAQGNSSISESEVEAMRNVCGNAYLGGADTTVCALQNFVLAMALHQDVQKKVQKGLDEVLGGTRLPDFGDFDSVPYLLAVINEVFRWHPVTPFAIYHVANSDDVYNGYEIPKGSMMVPNVYAIMHDEQLFGPDPDKFIPERFMKEGGPQFSDVELAFGFGRRVCPGKLMARDTLWIMAATILTTYDITEATDMNGQKLTSDSYLEYTNAMVSFAPRVKVSFKLRVPESMIQESD